MPAQSIVNTNRDISAELMAFWQGQCVRSLLTSWINDLTYFVRRALANYLRMASVGALHVPFKHVIDESSRTYDVSWFTALCIYDHLLMIERERRLIWKRKISVASLIYILTRCAALLENIAFVLEVTRLRYRDAQSSVDWVSDARSSTVYACGTGYHSDIWSLAVEWYS